MMTFHKNDPVTVRTDTYAAPSQFRGRSGVVFDPGNGRRDSTLVRFDLRSGDVANEFAWIPTNVLEVTKRYSVGDKVTLTKAYVGNRPHLIGAKGEVIRTDGGTAKPYSVKFENLGKPEFGWFTEAELEPTAEVVEVEVTKAITDDEHQAGLDAAVLAASRVGVGGLYDAIERAIRAYRESVGV